MNVQLPESWKEWTIVGDAPIGQGSYGTVYKAERILEDRKLYSAIKIIDIPRDAEELHDIQMEYVDEESVQAYLDDTKNDYVKEIELMADLHGLSNVVTIEDFFVEENLNNGWRIYIRMECLQDLRIYVRENEMTEQEVVKLALDMCNALMYCEKQNIIHRDIKPANILRSSLGDYKLGDFGIARMGRQTTGSYSTKGTFEYMAPEVYKAQPYGMNADIYSLGIVMYWLTNLTDEKKRNRFPFEDTQKEMLSYRDREDALERRLNGEALPKPNHASDELSYIILKACAYDPEERYQTAEEMYDDLQNIGKKVSTKVKALLAVNKKNTQKSTDQKSQNSNRRYEALVGVCLLLVLLVFAGGIIYRSSLNNTFEGVKVYKEPDKDSKLLDTITNGIALQTGNCSEDYQWVEVKLNSEGETVGWISYDDLCVMSAMINTEIETEESNEEISYETLQYTVMRDEPSSDGEIIGGLTKGNTLSGPGKEKDGWIEIYDADFYAVNFDERYKTGWVPADHVMEIDGWDDSEYSDEDAKFYDIVDQAIEDFDDNSSFCKSMIIDDVDTPYVPSIWDIENCKYYSNNDATIINNRGQVIASYIGRTYVMILPMASYLMFEYCGGTPIYLLYQYTIYEDEEHMLKEDWTDSYTKVNKWSLELIDDIDAGKEELVRSYFEKDITEEELEKFEEAIKATLSSMWSFNWDIIGENNSSLITGSYVYGREEEENWNYGENMDSFLAIALKKEGDSYIISANVADKYICKACGGTGNSNNKENDEIENCGYFWNLVPEDEICSNCDGYGFAR